MQRIHSFLIAHDWARISLGVGLIAIWLFVLAGAPVGQHTQLASWLVFLGLLIAPGYLLGDLVTRRLGLDSLERLALALPMGIVVLAVPGLTALLQHRTIQELATGWMLASALVVLVWLADGVWMLIRSKPPTIGPRWALDELLLFLLLAVGFAALVPTLNLAKIDGDAYAVASFSADALAGLPLNATEPLFGTSLGPGVRMVFNQTLPMAYLWSYFSGIDPITLAASASRAMPALWALLAAYALGRAAVQDSRRIGLFTAAIALLIYAAAPFLRGDNVSLFFFERTNADKFLVPVTMLPVAFALAMRLVRDGRWQAWVAAALVALAVSAIHPLVAVMLTVGLAGFAGLHLLLNLRQSAAWRRTLAVGGLIAVAMAIPLVQLVVARGDAPLAASFPASFEGWPVGIRQVPVLPIPGADLPTLDTYGPLPGLAELKASQVDSDATNPFLIWRFAVNMARRRLLIFDQQHYISDPNLIYEPPYLLAILLAPLLAWRAWRNRSDVGAQFVVGSTAAVLLVLFTPWLTPWIGSVVMPWILWRFVWVLPVALAIALAGAQLAGFVAGRIQRTRTQSAAAIPAQGFAMLALIVVATLALGPAIGSNLRTLRDRTASPTYFPAPVGIFAQLRQVTTAGPATVLADQDLSVTIPAYVANASIIAHRMPTTSEVFPADRQAEALQRLIDQDAFFRSSFLTAASLDVLRRYDVRYVITASGSDLDMQLRLSPQWFRWLMDDQSYSLYAVDSAQLAESQAILGNAALARRQWQLAEAHYRAALSENPGELLALVGLAEIAHGQGHAGEAERYLRSALDRVGLANAPGLHYQLGRLVLERNELDSARAEFTAAVRQAPQVARFHEALGDVCLTSGDEACAAEHYHLAVTTRNLPGEDSRLIAEGDLWRRRGHTDGALEFYQRAAALRPSVFNRLTLVDALSETGQVDRAATLAAELRKSHPLSAEIAGVEARLAAARGQTDRAVDLYRRAVAIQTARTEDGSRLQLALAGVLLDANRLDEAGAEIDDVLGRQPYDPLAYRLRGDFWRKKRQPDNAVDAYRRALALDPSHIDTYVSLRNQLRQQGGRPEELSGLLATAIAANPDEANLAVDLGDQWQRLGDNQAAIDAYGEALTKLNALDSSAGLRPLSTHGRQAVVQARLAGLYEDRGEVDSAMAFYRAAVAADPDTAWPRVLLGDALRRRGELSAAEASYRSAIEREPGQPEGYERLADLLLAAGRGDEARELGDKMPPPAGARLEQSAGASELSRLFSRSAAAVAAMQSDETMPAASPHDVEPDGSGADGSAAGLLLPAHQPPGRGNAAVENLRRQIDQAVAENRDPVILARYYKDLGDLYESLNRRDEAEAAYRQSLSLDRWWPDTHLALAEVVAARGALTETLQLVQAAVAIAPGSVEAQLALARQHDLRGEDALALDTYQAVARAHPGNAQATLALAQAWQARGQLPEAEHAYTQTIAVNPGAPAAYTGLAEVRIDQARYEEARKLLEQALALDHQDVVVPIRLGDVAQANGHVELARGWYEQAATLVSPGHPGSQALLAALIDGRHFDLAQRVASVALAVRPDEAGTLVRLAQIYRATGRLDEAQATAEQAAAASPHDAQPLAELARIYELRGRPELALEAMLQAVSSQPNEAEHVLTASRLLVAQGRFDEAVTLLKAGQAHAQRPDALTVALHDLQLARGDEPGALATISQALLTRGPRLELLLAQAAHADATGRYADAQETYHRIRAELAGDAGAALAQADRILNAGAEGSALYYSRLAHLLARVDPHVLLTLGRAYRQAGQTDEATAVYSRTLALEPELVEGYLELGEIYQERGQVAEARALYERGLAIMPFADKLLGRYTALLADQGEPERALALAAQATEQTPTAGMLLAQAALFAKLGEPEQAIDVLWTALEKEPASVDVLSALSDVYATHHWTAAAHDVNARLIELYPGLAVGYLRQGALAETQGKPDEARAAYERGLAAASSSSDLLGRAALFLAGQGEASRAKRLVDDAVKAFPSGPNRLARAALYARLGDTGEAMAEVQAVLARQPSSADALVALGDLAVQQGKAAEARQAFKTAVDRYPGMPAGYLRLGNLAMAEGALEEAGSSYGQGLAVAPYSPELLARAAVVWVEQQDLDRARQLADRAVKLAPSAQSLGARATVYAALGEVDRAVLDLQAALAVDPASPDSWLALGDLYAAHDRPDEARASYERVVELYPQLPAGYLRLGKLASDQGDRAEAQRYMALAREAQKLAAAAQDEGAGG